MVNTDRRVCALPKTELTARDVWTVNAEKTDKKKQTLKGDNDDNDDDDFSPEAGTNRRM